MINSKLIVYLKTLSAAEMKDLGLFISIAKGSKDATLFHSYVAKHHPNYPEKEIDKKAIAEKLYPTEKNKAKKLVNTMHRYSQLLDDFLIQEELKDDKAERNLLLLQALKKRKLNKFFYKKTEQLEKDWQKNKPPGLAHLHKEFRLKEMYFGHSKDAVKKRQPINIHNVIKKLDGYYVAMKLYWHLKLHNNNSYLSGSEKQNKEKHLITDLQNICLDGFFEDEPQIELFSYLLGAFIRNNFSNYDILRNKFVNNFDLYLENEKNEITMILISACYQNHRLGKPEALNQLFELNCMLVENRFIITDGYILSEQFWNIVTVGFEVKKFAWTEKFINQFGSYLLSDEKESFLAICKAMISFYKKAFTDALQILATVKFQNMFYALYARNIQLKCYYELDASYEEPFLDFTNSFYMYLFRNTNISDTIKEDFKNLIIFCKELYKIKNKTQENNILSLKKKITSETKVASKNWLLEKVNELITVKT